MICTWILKNRVWKIQFDELDFLSISNDFYCLCSLQKSGLKQTKNPVCRTWFFKLDFSKIKCRTIGGVQAKFTAVVENISYSTQVYGNLFTTWRWGVCLGKCHETYLPNIQHSNFVNWLMTCQGHWIRVLNWSFIFLPFLYIKTRQAYTIKWSRKG